MSNGLSDIAGIIYQGNANGFVLDSGIWTAVASLNLNTGTYIVTQYIVFPGASAGLRSIRLLNNDSVYVPSPQLLTATANEMIQFSGCTFIKIDGTATLGFQAYQNSGASMKLTTFIYRVLKIV